MIKVGFYKGGKRSITAAIIRWWTKGPYSHSEIFLEEDADGKMLGYSARLSEGVRAKWQEIDLTRWDFIEVDVEPAQVRAWFDPRLECKYDMLGIVGFVFRPVEDERNKYFCSETTAASIGIKDAWRFDPNTLKVILDKLITT